MKVFLNGSKGRMGQTLTRLIGEKEHALVGQADQGDQLSLEFAGAEVVLDFSLHHATGPLIEKAAGMNLPVVIGTTGHSETERNRILDFVKQIPVVWSGNYSIGVNVLLYLTQLASEKLPLTFEPEIIEAHHRKKIDAPSGTAENLVDAVLDGRNWSRESVIYGREGMTGERPNQELGVHAVRGGGIVGDHTVMFAGPDERIELKHQASDRSIFAEGALRAAEWVIGKPAGLYTMRDVLGLSELPK